MSGSDDKELIATARSVLLFLLSVSAVAHAVQAWGDPAGWGELALALWVLTIGVSLVTGELLVPHLEAIEEVKRERIRVFASVSYPILAVPGLVAAAVRPDAATLPTLVTTLAALHPGFLLLVGLGRERKGVLASALTLSLFACLGGGFLAASSAVCTVTLLGCFLVLDHYFRTLSTYPTGPGTWFGLAVKDALGTVLPAAVGLALILRASPPKPVPTAFSPVPMLEARTETVAQFIVTLLAGAVAVYVVGRLISRTRRKIRTRLEVVEPVRGGVERLPLPPPPPTAPVYPGRRGLVVRAYLRFLGAAARAGLTRPPGTTPREFAIVVQEPSGPLGSLTEAFVRARYGPAEPTPDDVLAAETGAETLVQALRLRGSRQAKARAGTRRQDMTRTSD